MTCLCESDATCESDARLLRPRLAPVDTAPRGFAQLLIVLQLDIPAAWLVNYGLLLLRTSTLVLFVPLPGARQTLRATKVAVAMMLGFVLAPHASVGPGIDAITSAAAPWLLAEAVLAEVALGASIGVAYRLVLESFSLAAQILGFQAGYSYVNMVDPTS